MKEIFDRELHNVEDYLEKYGPFESPKCWNERDCTVTKWENDKYILYYYDYEAHGVVKLLEKD